MKKTIIICAAFLLSTVSFSQGIVFFGGSNASEIPYVDYQTSIDKTTFKINGNVGDDITIFWGDGSSSGVTFTGPAQTIEKTYGSTGTYYCRIVGDLKGIRFLECSESHVMLDANAVFNASSGIDTLKLVGNLFRGNLGSVPEETGDIQILHLETVGSGFSGNASDIDGCIYMIHLHLDCSPFPLAFEGVLSSFHEMSSLRYLHVKRGAFSGDLAGFHSQLVDMDTLVLDNCGSVSGELSDIDTVFRDLVYLKINTINIAGTTSQLLYCRPNLKYLYFNPQTSGNIDMNMDTLSLFTNLEYLYLNGCDFFGDWVGLESISGLKYLYIDNVGVGSSTSGDISDIDGLNSLITATFPSGVSYALDGDLHTFLSGKSALTSLQFGTGSELNFTTATIPSGLTNITLTNCSLAAAEVDSFLVCLNRAGSSNGTLYIGGSNGTRSSASDAAKTALVGRGWTIEVNE